MTTRLFTVAVGCVLACTVGVLWSWSRAASARSQATTARAQLVAVQADVSEVERLRSGAVHAHADQPSEDDLLARVRRTLRESGIAERSLKQVTRPNDQAIGGSGGSQGSPYARRTERVVLEPLTLPELGSWMRAWRASEPLWTISQVEFRSVRGTESSGAYAVTIDLTTTFVRTPEGMRP